MKRIALLIALFAVLFAAGCHIFSTNTATQNPVSVATSCADATITMGDEACGDSHIAALMKERAAIHQALKPHGGILGIDIGAQAKQGFGTPSQFKARIAAIDAKIAMSVSQPHAFVAGNE